MDGGAISKNAYRYQDWCALYFALENFKDNSLFEYIYCEQDKLDFEIWDTESFVGFQVKTNPSILTAKETNNIFLYYLNKSITSGRESRSFKFIFSKYPTKSLGHLFSVIKEGGKGVRYGRRIQKFIDTALENIPLGEFPISFHFFEEKDIRQKVFTISADILKSKINKEDDISTEIINNFIARLRDEIDLISCKNKQEERNHSLNELELLINNFINTFRAERLEDNGKHAHIIKIELPKDLLRINRPRIIIDMNPLNANENEIGKLQ